MTDGEKIEELRGALEDTLSALREQAALAYQAGGEIALSDKNAPAAKRAHDAMAATKRPAPTAQ